MEIPALDQQGGAHRAGQGEAANGHVDQEDAAAAEAVRQQASDVANMSAPPPPWALRETISISGPSARPHSREPRVKITSPIANSSLRPCSTMVVICDWRWVA